MEAAVPASFAHPTNTKYIVIEQQNYTHNNFYNSYSLINATNNCVNDLCSYDTMYEVETNIENKAAYNALNVAYCNVSKRKNTVPVVVQSSKRQALCIGTPQNTENQLLLHMMIMSVY